MAGARLTDEQVMDLDPYSFVATIGKKVVRPGGHRSTEELFSLAGLTPSDRVLDVGCGVGVTGIEIVQRFGSDVTISDKSERMLGEARANVAAAGMDGRIRVDAGDILALPYEDDTFDVTIVEAVTMFVDRDRAIREVVRVTKPGGRILDHEFCWRDRPNLAALEVLRQPMMCPGINFDDVRNWEMLFERHGVTGLESVVGPFALLMPRQFVADEGLRQSARIVARVCSRRAYRRKAAFLIRNIVKIMPKLGYIVLRGTKAPVPIDPKSVLASREQFGTRLGKAPYASSSGS
jgi:SAM-dependent methyltransferase